MELSILVFIASLVNTVLSQSIPVSLDEIDKIDKGIRGGILKHVAEVLKFDNISLSEACQFEIEQWAVSMKNKDVWAYQSEYHTFLLSNLFN